MQEAGADHSRLALDALGVAQELCTKAAGIRGTRQAYFIGQLMAQEHLAAGDPATARRLLLLVAGVQALLSLPKAEKSSPLLFSSEARLWTSITARLSGLS